MTAQTSDALQKLLEANNELLSALDKVTKANTAIIEAVAGRAPQYITAQEYASRFKLSTTTVYRHVRTGVIQGKFIGRRCYVVDPALST